MINNQNSQLKDFIHIEKGVIPSQYCNDLIEFLKDQEWNKSLRYNSIDDNIISDDECDMCFISPEDNKQFNTFIIEAGTVYNNKYSYLNSENTSSIMEFFTPVRFNRYNYGQFMNTHQDHIRSIFDGERKGIPVLSFIFNFNDDYEGADLCFWDDYIIPLAKGDIVMFPSTFLFPHRVTKCIKGTRYSGAVWGW
tara:strand:+ start:318 stop:899 length:582 start_codon:yes stop_codon:yes gene_type:complete